MAWYTEAFGSWYGVVYPHRNRAEAARLAATLNDLHPLAGVRLLDVGCGPGRHLSALAGLGARPHGLDLSPELLAEARRVRAEDAGAWPLVRGDMRSLPFGRGSFGAVTSLFTSFGYFGPEDDRRVLDEAARVLAPGGLHVLDFLNRRQALEHPNPVTSRRSGAYRVDEARRIEGGRQVVKEVVIRPGEGGDPLASYEERVTLYDEVELGELLAAAGLRPFRALGDYEGGAFDPASSPRLVILSKREDG